MPGDRLHILQQRLREFASRRDWLEFQSPKNLSMALIAEAAELVEQFQWLSETQSRELSPERRQQAGMELADIQIFLLRLADQLDIDLLQMVEQKILLNEQRYPVDKVRGKARRASEYDED